MAEETTKQSTTEAVTTAAKAKAKKGALGIAAGVAWRIVAAKKSYDNSKTVKNTVEKFISELEKAVKIADKFLRDNGVKVRDKIKKGKNSEAAKKVSSMFQSSLNKVSNVIGRKKTNEEGEIAAIEGDKLEGDHTSSTDPPKTSTLSVEELRKLADKYNMDLTEKDDGEPTEKDYLKEIAEAVSEDGELSIESGDSGKKKRRRLFGWMTGRDKRMEDRSKQIEEEKERVRNSNQDKKKKGFFEKLFSNPALFFMGLMLAPLKFISKKFGSIMKWTATKILKGMWWITKKSVGGLLKGMWWLLKKGFGALGKGLKLFGKGLAKITPKWVKSLGSKLGDLGKTFKNSIVDLGKNMKGWFSDLGSKLGSLKETLKPKNLVNKGWNFLKNAFGKGGMFRSIAGTIGRVAVRVGARVLAGVVAVGPVGWVIGIGLALWGAYELYKYFKDGKGKFPDTPAGNISQLRMYSYGLSSELSHHFKKMFELEEVIGRFLLRKHDGEVEIRDIDEDGQKAITEIMGLNPDFEGEKEKVTMEWLYGRFIPAYIEFMRVLWNEDTTKKAGELDKLKDNDLATLIYDYDLPGTVWDIDFLPFEDAPKSNMTREEFNEFHLSIKNTLKTEWESEATKRKVSERQAVKSRNAAIIGGTIGAFLMKEGIWNTSGSNSSDDPNDLFSVKGGLSHTTKTNAQLEDILLKTGNTSRGAEEQDGVTGEVNSGDVYYDEPAYSYAKGSSFTPMRTNMPSFTDYLNGKGQGGSGYGNNSYNNKSIRPYNGPMYNYDVRSGDGSVISGAEMGNMSLDQVFKRAAEMTGMPEEILWAFAKLETGLNPMAKAKGSSASGLFQMINATWKTMVERYGKRYGITPQNANRWNPLQNTLMGAEYMKENLKNIKGYKELGLDLGTALYFAHFFGGGGVKRFFEAMRRNPDAPMRTAVSEKVYNANLAAMGGLTIRQFVDKYRARFNTAMTTPAGKYKGYRDHRSMFPQLYEGSKPNDLPKSMDFTVGEGEGGDVPSILGTMTTGDGGNFGGMFGSPGAGGFNGSILGNNGICGNFSDGNIGTDLSNYNMDGSNGQHANNASDVYGSDSYQNFDHNSVGASNPGDYIGEKEVLGYDYGSGSNSIGVSVHPIKAGYPFYFTSLFGPRNTGIKGASTDHGGVDIGTPTKQPGVPIVSTGPGKVWRAYSSKSYGLVVYVNHPDGLQTRYAHLSKILVREGQEVEAGTLVGLMGNTGVGSGVHLHYETRRGHGQYGTKLDPFTFDVIKKSYKGYKVPTVIEENGTVDSDESKTDENLENQLLDDIGAPLPMGLAGLILQRDPATGELTSEVGESSNETGDERFDSRVSSNNVNSHSNDSYGNIQDYNSLELERRKNAEEQQRAQQEVKVDVDVRTSSLEQALRENNVALTQMTEVIKSLIEKKGTITDVERSTLNQQFMQSQQQKGLSLNDIDFSKSMQRIMFDK